MYLYHGSYIGKIEKLIANSKKHNGKDEKIVYLTSNYAYALFYIWDSIKNHRAKKLLYDLGNTMRRFSSDLKECGINISKSGTLSIEKDTLYGMYADEEPISIDITLEEEW